MLRRESPHGLIALEVDGELRLFPLAQSSAGVGVSFVGAFPPKQVIGDFTQDSHETNSYLSQSDWSGGGQITDAQEATDLSRYAEIATVETRFPRMLSLLPQTNEVVGPNEEPVRCLGEMWLGGVAKFFVAFGTVIRQIDATNNGATVVTPAAASLGFVPVSHGTVFGGSGATRMYIPGGANGYGVFNGSDTLTVVTSKKPVQFINHDSKLWLLDTDGQLWKTTDGSTWTSVVKLDAMYQPKGLVVFYDRSDATTPHIVTDKMVFSVDAGAPAIYETELNYPPHPTAALAYARWRTDLYVSIGLGVQRYTLGTVNSSGPDRDDGPGRQFRGYVQSMERGFNELWALVAGASVDGEEEVFDLDEGREVVISPASAQSTLLKLTGLGSWHTAWASETPGGDPTNVLVTAANGHYRVYWGWSGRLYYQNIPVNFENPRINEAGEYAPSGSLTSSWFDMQMRSNRMTLGAFDLWTSGCSETETVELWYQVDAEDETDTWHLAGRFTTNGLHHVRTGLDGVMVDGRPRYTGVGFSRVRYRLELARGTDPSKTPIVESIVLVFIKTMNTLRSFRFRVDCSSAELDTGWGYGNRERREVLGSLLESERFLQFVYQDTPYMVKVAGVTGQDATGMDLRGDRDVVLIESMDTPDAAV